MKMSSRYFAGIFMLTAVLIGGRTVPILPRPEPGKLVIEFPVVPPPAKASRWHDEARLLAGLPVSPDSPLYELSLCPSFRRHAAEMAIFWKRAKVERVDRIAGWREANIPRDLENNTVLYPLSGADFLNAYSFFPSAQGYIFIALEPPGREMDLYLMTDEHREAGLACIRRVVDSLAVVNYLQSKILRKELSNPYIPGTLPLFLLFAGGFGHTVEEVHTVAIDTAGKIHDTDLLKAAVARGEIPGVRIGFRDGYDGRSKTILYLQIRLREEAVGDSTPEGKFLGRLKNCNTFLKSAVYLLHDSEYKAVRDFILERSDLVVQDDSGIPYSSFPGDTWQEHLFGVYTRILPLGGIANPPQQPHLAERYLALSKPLGFLFGYGVLQGSDQSNLMMFVKRTAGDDRPK